MRANEWPYLSQYPELGDATSGRYSFFYKTSNFDMGSFAQFQVPRESVVSTYQVYSRLFLGIIDMLN